MSDKRQDITNGLLLPAGQAVLTGLLFAGVITAGWKVNQGITAWRLFFLALALGCFAAWLLIWGKWRSWIDADHGIKPIEPEIIKNAETVRVELQSQAAPYQAVEWLDIPIDWEQLAGVCHELRARNYETSNLGGAGKALTRAEAERLRDYLIGHDLAQWNRTDAHVAGWRLSGSGRALVRRICDIATTYQSGETHHPAGFLPMGANTHRHTEEARWTNKT